MIIFLIFVSLHKKFVSKKESKEMIKPQQNTMITTRFNSILLTFGLLCAPVQAGIFDDVLGGTCAEKLEICRNGCYNVMGMVENTQGTRDVVASCLKDCSDTDCVDSNSEDEIPAPEPDDAEFGYYCSKRYPTPHDCNALTEGPFLSSDSEFRIKIAYCKAHLGCSDYADSYCEEFDRSCYGCESDSWDACSQEYRGGGDPLGKEACKAKDYCVWTNGKDGKSYLSAARTSGVGLVDMILGLVLVAGGLSFT